MTDIQSPIPAPPHAVPLLTFALAANAIGHSFALIVLPPLGRQLGFGDMRTSLLVGGSALLLTLAGPVWGWICDRWGRRPALLAGLAAAMLFAATFAAILYGRSLDVLDVSTAFALLLSARLTQAILTAGLMPGAQAYLADTTSARRRAGGMGMMGAAFGCGTVAGAVLSWRLGGDNAITALMIICAIQAVALCLLAVGLPETGRRMLRTEAPPMRLRGLWPFLLVTFMGLAAYSLLQQVTALRLQDGFGLSPQDSIRTGGGMMVLAMAAMVLVQGGVVRRLSWPPHRLAQVGGLGAALALAVATLAPALPVLAAAMALLGAALGLLIPGNLAALSLRAGPAAQARGAGLNAIGQGFGFAAGPIMGAGLHQMAPWAPYAAATVLLVLVCCVVFQRRIFAD